jgi:hypothetical protein
MERKSDQIYVRLQRYAILFLVEEKLLPSLPSFKGGFFASPL